MAVHLRSSCACILPWAPLVAFYVLFGTRHVALAAIVALVGSVGNILFDACCHCCCCGRQKKWPKFLDLGFVAAWVLLLIFTLVTPPRINQDWAAVLVNAVMFFASLLSMGLNRPFTMQYDEVVGDDHLLDEENCVAGSPSSSSSPSSSPSGSSQSKKFLSLHHSMTLDWALGFGAMALTNILGSDIIMGRWLPPVVFDTIIPLTLLLIVYRIAKAPLDAYLARRKRGSKGHDDDDCHDEGRDEEDWLDVHS